jgi:hypothetical protein
MDKEYYDKILKIAEKTGYDETDFTFNNLEFLSTFYEEIMKEIDEKIDSLRTVMLCKG